MIHIITQQTHKQNPQTQSQTKKNTIGMNLQMQVLCNSENPEELVLPQTFFDRLASLEKEYYQAKSQGLIECLISCYADCVTYFDVRSQSASVYFQRKIKQLAWEVYRVNKSGTKFAKVQLSQNVMKSMEKEDIYNRIGKQMQRAELDKTKIEGIIKDQEDSLERRIKKTKRGLTKTFSATFSENSNNDNFSPEKTQRKPIKRGYLIFTNELNTEEDDEM